MAAWVSFFDATTLDAVATLRWLGVDGALVEAADRSIELRGTPPRGWLEASSCIAGDLLVPFAVCAERLQAKGLLASLGAD